MFRTRGVPAALFMAVTKTLIKTTASQGLTPEAVLGRVNNDLAEDIPSMMFCTLFLGLLDVRTGRLTYCNGGHNPPYVLRAFGGIECMETTHGVALGVMEDLSYQSKVIELMKGDTLFLFTDGVTEAMNKELELFSEARLEAQLSLLQDKSIEAIQASLTATLRSFSAGVPQADDITMLILRFHGRER